MKIGSIVIRCYEFDKMLAFSQEALHYLPKYPPESGWVILHDPQGKGPNISLDKVAERRTGKRSRLHLDLYTHDQEGEVERLVKIGATRYPWRYKPDDDFFVLEDPDGNLSCVVQVPPSENYDVRPRPAKSRVERTRAFDILMHRPYALMYENDYPAR